jgi:hypothetical protein
MPANLTVAEAVVNGEALVLVGFDAGHIAVWLTPAQLRQTAQDFTRKADALEAKVPA